MTSELEEPHVQGVEQSIVDCDITMCGSNSPFIAEFGFWDLNLPPAIGIPGKPNNIGLQIIEFRQGRTLYVPHVKNGKLTGTRIAPLPPHGTIPLEGSALAGSWFVLANGARNFRLKIVEVGSVESWALPVSGSPVMLETYRLDWQEFTDTSATDFTNVCKNPPMDDSSDLLGMTGASAFRTLLFEGDRIEAKTKVDTGIDTSWFNLGCAGHALAKLALTGHTEASRNAGTFVTTLDERQAMLKLFTADYCGDGTPFTVAGQPLNWRDDHGTMKLAALQSNPPQSLAREARWTAKGAACLDKPRVDVHWTDLGNTTFGPDVYDQVKKHCPDAMPPPCADSSFETDGYHLLSATVPFQP